MAVQSTHRGIISAVGPPPARPRFGGVLWGLARRTVGLTLPVAGKRWNPTFAVVRHAGRRTGREYETPVAARRDPAGFVVALAFGAQVDWYRNLQFAAVGHVRWRGDEYPVGAPEHIEPRMALAAFHPIQRLALRMCRIDGYVRLPDRSSAT